MRRKESELLQSVDLFLDHKIFYSNNSKFYLREMIKEPRIQSDKVRPHTTGASWIVKHIESLNTRI